MQAVFQKFSVSTALLMLFVICVLALTLLLYGAYGDSAIMDELAHIPSGYGYVHNLDYRLNPEHPPLVKALAAFPLLFFDLNFPTNDKAWTIDVNGQWDMGRKFLYDSGNDPNQIVSYARFGPILITLLLVIFLYLWARQLMGEWWALIPTFLFAMSPTVLAHGHYVTTDIGAAFGVVASTFYFLKFLNTMSKKNLLWAGLAFGLAELLKFSTALLVPYFLLLLIVFYAAGVMRDWEQTPEGTRRKRFFARAFKYAKALIAVFVIGYALVVYPVYALFTAHYPIAKQGADTEFILHSFAGGPTPDGQLCHAKRCLADLNIWMAKNPVFRPFAQYLLGILMVLQRSAGGNTNYFLGMVSSSGWHYYFPVIYALKEPLPVLIMVLLALCLTAWRMYAAAKHRVVKLKNMILDYLEMHFEEFAMFLFIIIYWAWSMKSPLNIGFRHLLPTIPFIYILTAKAWKTWIIKIDLEVRDTTIKTLIAWFRALLGASLKYVFMVMLLVWFFAETVFAAPYFLSYFNEAAMGPMNGYRYVTDSNYDWGQDLLRLKTWVDAHPEVDKIGVDYFGGGDPGYYLKGKEENWWSSRGNPANQNIHWLAVSVNTLEGSMGTLVHGEKRNAEDEYRWLRELRPPTPGMGNVPPPDFRIGTSIFVYHL